MSATSAGGSIGYGVAISVSILVLISTIILASYACVRIKSGRNHSSGAEITSGVGDPGGFSTPTVGGGGVLIGSSSSNRDSLLGLPGSMVTLNLFLGRPMTQELVLGESKRMPGPANSGSCSICLCEYRSKESVRSMADCNHCFHAGCIDQWLRMNPTCPLCRSSPAPTPITTPLSELVPLAFHRR